jgi:hypothetical protein
MADLKRGRFPVVDGMSREHPHIYFEKIQAGKIRPQSHAGLFGGRGIPYGDRRFFQSALVPAMAADTAVGADTDPPYPAAVTYSESLATPRGTTTAAASSGAAAGFSFQKDLMSALSRFLSAARASFKSFEFKQAAQHVFCMAFGFFFISLAVLSVPLAIFVLFLVRW